MARAGGVPLGTGMDGAPASRKAGLGTRTASALVLVPIFAWIVTAAPTWVYGLMVIGVAALGQWEFTGLFHRAGIRALRLSGLAAGTVVTASFAVPGPGLERIAFTLALLGLLAASLHRPRGERAAWEPLAVTVLGVCYVNWLLGHGIWLHELEGGTEWVLLLVAITWLGETSAYLVGSLIGRHRLAPVLSPKKTIEGAIAQFAVSVAVAVGAAAWFVSVLSPGQAAVVGALLGVSGQVGDLVESALKRSVGTKDAGHLIPGHGGVLDRVDGLLFNTPVLFYYAAYGRAWQS
jgi:phosphatidate cytidylyltransferase